MENNFDYLQQSPVRPEVKEVEKQIRVKSPFSDMSMQGGNPNAVPSVMETINLGVDTRQKAIDYSTPFLDVYKPLSSGEYVSMYETYIPGIDNQERLAQQQTTGEKWSNGVVKALSKTGSAIVGGTAGMVYGLGAALSEGSFSAIYDNDFSNKLNDWDTKLNYQLPNYYTKQEQEKGLGGQLGTANFWADKFLGGLSFTAGAIFSEAIWAAATGGTSLAARGAMLGTKLARGARWGTGAIGEAGVISGLSKYTKWVKNLLPETAYETGQISKALPNAFGKTGEVLSITGQLARSAGYEASVEALQFKKEAEENFYNNFASLNGREPNADDISKFNTDLEGAANGVFATNMAILMPSNLITLGHVLDIKSPIKTGITEFIDKKAFGYGLKKTAEGTFIRLAPTTSQKVMRGVFNYAIKPGVTEGFFEEGLQGVTTKVGNKWIENTYDLKNTAQTFDSIDAIGQSMAEQYGTKEGLVEVGLGVLIGMFGGAANVRGEQKQKEEELKYRESVGNAFADQNLFAKNLINHKVQTSNRVIGFSEDAKAEEAKGNIANSKLAKNSALLSFINSKQVLGESISETTEEVKKSLDSLTTEQWVEAGIPAENIEQEKTERIAEFESLAKQWKTNKSYWQYMVGGKLAGEQNLETTGLEKSLGGVFSKNAAIVEALTWQSTIGENAHTLMKDAQEVIGKEIGLEHTRTINTVGKLKELHSTMDVNISNLQKEHQANLAERDRLTKEIVKLNNTPKKTEGNKAQGQQLLNTQKRLLEVNENIAVIEQEAQAVAEKINATDIYRQNVEDIKEDFASTLISGNDLLKLNESIDKFKGALDFVQTTNPQRAQYLEDVLKEYSDAESVFLKHQATQKVLASPDFKIERIEGWLRGKVKAKKAMNENTQEWLQDALNSYTENKAEFISDLLSAEQNRTIVSDKEYNDFVKNDVVSAETLVQIAEKVKKGEKLDAKENEIYNSREKEVKEIISQSNTETQPKSEEQILKEKIVELEKERDAKITEIESTKATTTQNIGLDNSVQIEEELKKLEEEYDKKIADLEQEKSDLLEELKTSPSQKQQTPIITVEEIKSNLTEDEREILEQVIEENKSEGQTEEEFIQEEVKKELNGEESSLKGDSSLIAKFKAIIRKLAKIFAIGAVMWSTANPMADFLGRNDIVSREKTQFVIDLANAPSTITESSLTESQTDVLKQAIENAKSKGQTYVTYKEYPNQLSGVARVNPQTDAQGQNIISVDDETVVKRIIGQFSFIEQNGNYIISDRYNFNDGGQKSFLEGIEYIKEGFQSDNTTYSNIRRIATVFGSKEGEGAEVKITIPVKKTADKKETQTASLAGLGLLGLLRLKKQKGQTLTEEDLSKGRDRIAEIDAEISKLNQELTTKKAEINSKRTVTKQITTNNFEEKNKEIEKVRQSYAQKIKSLQPETRTNLEIYKDVLEKLLSNVYRGVNHMPANEEEARATQPTEADIAKYRELRQNKQTKSAEYKELENKLKSWKLLSSAVDENYTSIAEIISIIEQLETETQQEDTKAEVTEDEAKTVLRDDTETGGKRYSPEYLQNQLGNATVKNVKDSGKYSFSHIKLDYIINQLNADYTVTRKGKEISPDLEKLQVGDIVYVDGMPITYLAGGVLEMDINDFNSRQQVLNMYVSPVRTGTWTYLDVYTVKGNEMVKMPSQFVENIKPEEIYNQKEGDTLTAHIDDTDGWNKTSKGDNPEQLKIYFKDSKGNNLSVAKAGREAKNDASVIEYMEMRQVAYDRWVVAGKPEKLDLGITAKIDNIFFGSAGFITDENGKILNVPITQEEVENVIIGKGYIQNGEFKLDTELKDVNATFVGKLSKDNPTLKVPVIVFKKGVHIIAFPITMNKTNTPVEFDSILNSGKSPQEIVLAINDAIIKNNLDTPKLVYADINDEEKLNITREAFASKQSYVSADTLASSDYKKQNLVNDALINIDLSNLDNAISSPKIRIDLDSIELGDIKDFKNETKTEIENSLNDVAREIEKFNNNQYLDKKGEAVENEFTDFIGENPTVEATNQLNKIKNVNILRGQLSLMPKSFRTLFGEDKIKAAKNAILRYDSISRQTSSKDVDKKSGKKASDCK